MTGPGLSPDEAARHAKHQLRTRMIEQRARRSPAEVAEAGMGFRDQALTMPEVAAGPRVALFLGRHGEPDTRSLVDALHTRGVEVLLPILLDDFDLDWAPHRPGQHAPGRFGLLVPTTSPLGADAIATVAAVVCPGVAVDREGNRIGRGGGSYDRALARCGPTVLRCQLAYDDEVVAAAPTHPHDQPVAVVVTPTRTIRAIRFEAQDG